MPRHDFVARMCVSPVFFFLGSIVYCTLVSTISSLDGSIDTTISSVSKTGQVMSANGVSVLERCSRTRPSGEPKSVPFFPSD